MHNVLSLRMRIGQAVVTTLVPLCFGLASLVYTGPGALWWRAHAGDALVVAFLVGLAGVAGRLTLRVRLLAVAILCTGLELAQLGASASRGPIAGLVLGSTFDPLDFVYYAIGLVLAVLLDRIAVRYYS